MAGRRIAYVALPVAAAGGYYFYAAGGDSKVAQKKAERLSIGTLKESFELPSLYELIDDVEKAKSSLKGQNISGAEAKKQGEEWAQIAGSKIDHTVCLMLFFSPLSHCILLTKYLHVGR